MSMLSYVFGSRMGSGDKKSAYECGYEAFEDGRDRFEVKFYLIGLFFIIFDLEIGYVLPYIMIEDRIGDMGIVYILDFILELIIGYIFIWRTGGIEINE